MEVTLRCLVCENVVMICVYAWMGIGGWAWGVLMVCGQQSSGPRLCISFMNSTNVDKQFPISIASELLKLGSY